MIVHAYYLNDTRVRREAEFLTREGFIVDIICLNKGHEKGTETYNNVNIFRCNVSRSVSKSKISYISEYLKFFLKSFIRLNLLFFKNKYNIIFIHNMPNFLVFTTILQKLFCVKVILDMHDTMPELYSDIFNINNSFLKKLLYFEEKISCLFANYLITVNEPIVELFKNRINKDFFVLHNSPDPNIYNLQRQMNWEFSPTPKLIYHGNIHKRYGLVNVLHMLSVFSKEGLNFKFIVHGVGPHYNEVKEIAKLEGLDKLCEFNGEYKPEEIIDQLIKCDFGIIPYNKNNLTDILLPVKLLEYVYLRIPVICRRLKTIEYYFDDDCVFYYDTEEDLLKTLRLIMNNKHLVNDRIINAAKKGESIGWNIERKKFLSYIEEISE